MSSDSWASGLFGIAALVSAIVTLMIFFFMAVLGWPVLTGGSFLHALLGPWTPDHHNYGILPMIVGTLCIAGVGFVVAVPLSLGSAVFIQVVEPRGLGRLLQRLVQLMTGIPTVIYGFVGIFLLVPLIRNFFGRGSGLCILTAAMMLAVLISPTMILFFTDGLAGVPGRYCRAVSALGGTSVQRLLYVQLPQAWRSILAGMALGFGRAVGDTMIALMLAGNAVAFPESVFDPARTLTAHIALIIAADFDSPEFRSLFICGMTLYLITTTAVIVMRRIAEKHLESL